MRIWPGSLQGRLLAGLLGAVAVASHTITTAPSRPTSSRP